MIISKYRLMRMFLFVWLVGAIVSFFLHFFYPILMSNLSFWNSSLGWQREIALWNLGIIFAVIFCLIKNDKKILRFMIIILMVISILLGTNHLLGLISNKQATQINLLGAILNFIMVFWGGFILKNENKKR